MKKQISIFFILFVMLISAKAETSVAGFYQLTNSGRIVYQFNNGWKFHKGDIPQGESPALDDTSWEVVSVPHSAELVPAEASGGKNYQGIVWYRKSFVVPADLKDKDLYLHFEAIMGKQKYYVNGKLVKENFGGYLPVTLNLTTLGVKTGESCLVSVCADNSNDKSYPPGKPQYTLDFAYHGGMYRDVWLIGKSQTAVTDAIESGKVAGGGMFVHFDKISEKSAEVYIDTEIGNSGKLKEKITLETRLIDPKGKIISKSRNSFQISGGKTLTIKQKHNVNQPQLWSPEHPDLYRVEFNLIKGKISVDGGAVRAGIRLAEFRGELGFFLNGKRSPQLIGGNRHQDFAYVGNAVPNNQQWLDAKRLRDAGCTIIRTAHYPQDPAFMDACDELGVFIIVATPGWQYWNKDPEFENKVHENTRQIIRRDRNHPSVLLWEPILNETRFPLAFSMKALQITKDEFPYPGAPLAAADLHSEGVAEHYGVVYGWPEDKGKVKQSLFTREFGENVDDWYAHNANNRSARHWGEKPMKVAALSLADTYGTMFHGQPQFIGGAQWHPFDHQRGYHPDPYWGGIFDAFRQPKYAYYMFKSQVNPALNIKNVHTGPMVYVMNEMTPFSDKDVVVFSNCDSVRLTVYEGQKVVTLPVIHSEGEIPYKPVVFENIFDFWEMRDLTYKAKKPEKVSIKAEGIIGGKVVCTETKMPSRRSTKIRLSVDQAGGKLTADGSDFAVIIAEITDDNGNVRRLAKESILFSVEGEGKIIGDQHIGANPRAVEWGSAPVLIQSTTRAGVIKIKAKVLYEGTHTPISAEMQLESVPAAFPVLAEEQVKTSVKKASSNTENKIILSEEEKKKLLNEVEIQQSEFGIKK